MPYLQNATHEGFIFDETRKAEFAGNGTHAAMAMQYFVANLPTGQLDTNNQPIYANYNIGQAVGFYSSNGTGANLTEVYANPLKLAISTKETELSNVTVWTANSILTQGRADSRYLTTLPTATNTTLGAIKVGQTLEIANGVLNVTDLTLFGGTATASGPDVYFGGGA